MAADPKPYAAAWSNFRKRRRRFWLFYFGYPACALALVSLADRFANPEPLLLLSFFSFVVITVPLAVQYKRFACPRCGQPFFVKGLFSNGYVRRCRHCGLPKWSEYSSGEPDI